MSDFENKYARRTSYDRYAKAEYDENDIMLASPLDDGEDAENSASTSPRVAKNRRYLQQLHEQGRRDPRFQPPTASKGQRVALLVFLAFLFWVALFMRRDIWNVLLQSESDAELRALEADRYSDDHMFRPAASPVITETLDNGYVRLRGAQRTGL
ncbi:hypothetical protein HGRIS_000459 [Hohenbuehelia grisea]|uniref:Uncharacterized protein n=1 Tax=Hohenbuehelia grisea TaxID=104357 RepID=A0ABR3JRR6_9AGAR